MKQNSQYVYENGRLLSFLTGNNSLIDSTINKIEIYSENKLVLINILIQMRPTAICKQLELQFIDCIEYEFFYSKDYYFYSIEQIKFLSTEDNKYYISFDPDESENGISEDDQDYIKSKAIKGYIIV